MSRFVKWFKMLTGKSLLHVEQGIGKQFSKNEIRGYYNDLSKKVTEDKKNVSTVDYIPKFTADSGQTIEVPVSIFQYGLGCYDLYLETADELYLNKFNTCVDWAESHIKENGSFDAFSFIYPDSPYGAMCQGEAASLFLRAHAAFADEKYLRLAKSSLDFMLLSQEQGGTASYTDDGVVLLEYTNLPAVLNGWIFAIFALFDAKIVFCDEKYSSALESTLKSLKRYLPRFDNGYWSMYDADKKIASPFYHGLHIAQLEALFKLTGDEAFSECSERFVKYKNSLVGRTRAFIKKGVQKIFE